MIEISICYDYSIRKGISKTHTICAPFSKKLLLKLCRGYNAIFWVNVSISYHLVDDICKVMVWIFAVKKSITRAMKTLVLFGNTKWSEVECSGFTPISTCHWSYFASQSTSTMFLDTKPVMTFISKIDCLFHMFFSKSEA